MTVERMRLEKGRSRVSRRMMWYRYSKENGWKPLDDYLVRVYRSAQDMCLDTMKTSGE